MVRPRKSPFSLRDFVRGSGTRKLTLVANMTNEDLCSAFDTLERLGALPRVHSMRVVLHSRDRTPRCLLCAVGARSLSGLRHLSLSDVSLHPDFKPHWSWFSALAGQLTSIELCRTRSPSSVRLPVFPTLAFSRLRCLTFHRYGEHVLPLLVNGIFPSLTQLHLGHAATCEAPSRLMPSLRLLTMEAKNADCSRLPFIFFKLAPKLDCVEFTSGNDYYKEHFLEHFEFAYKKATYDKALSHAPSLRRVVLRGGTLTLRMSILQKINHRREALVLPPHLWDVELENVQLVSDHEKAKKIRDALRAPMDTIDGI
ncbi:hypothetical protein CALVIDRAFT_539363 [Calocera viscosa TUFC12733]|uniref:F-box domain-containing protein n=1 Tax=Calocera viscosa (strain TUFC12733) TaxID=1330018 RepID=A0A167JW75_CALVF|nr:hypothetical protein CALVIDRAFT_539363 [Calocera viscosa TUFC12733]